MPLLVSFCATFLGKAILKSNQQTKEWFSISVKLCGISQTWQPTTQCNYFTSLKLFAVSVVGVSHMKKKILKPSFSARLNALNSHLITHTNFTGIPASEGDFVGFHTMHFHTHSLNSPQILLRCGPWHSIVTSLQLECSNICLITFFIYSVCG